MKKKRLATLKQVRLYLADLINDTRAGKVDLNMAGKIGYLINILTGIITSSDLESRIEALEKQIEEEPGRRKKRRK